MSFGYGYGNPLDLNRDGFVSRQEFTYAGAAYGGTGGALAASRLFNALDTNQNGYLDAFDRARPAVISTPVVYPSTSYYPSYF